jgi:thiol-disulfide isomerase/thioredoxin
LLADLVLAGVCFALVFAVFFWRPFSQPDPIRHPAVGKPADFVHVYSLDDLVNAGRAFASPVPQAISPLTLDTLRGHVTLVVFWGPWVPTSEEVVSHLADVLPMTTREDFRFVAIACPPPPDRNLPEDFLAWTQTAWQELRLPASCYVDLERTSQYRFLLLDYSEVAEAASLRPLPIPTIVLIDRSGIIRAVWMGWLAGYDGQLREMVDQLLGPAVRKAPGLIHDSQPPASSLE